MRGVGSFSATFRWNAPIRSAGGSPVRNCGPSCCDDPSGAGRNRVRAVAARPARLDPRTCFGRRAARLSLRRVGDAGAGVPRGEDPVGRSGPRTALAPPGRFASAVAPCGGEGPCRDAAPRREGPIFRSASGGSPPRRDYGMRSSRSAPRGRSGEVVRGGTTYRSACSL